MQSIIVNPDTDPHAYEPTRERRAHDGRREARDRERHRLRQRGPRSCSPRTRSRGRTALDVGDLLGLKEGDNPHQWYSPATRAEGDRRDRRRLRQARPGRQGVLRRAEAALRDGLARDVQPAARARSAARFAGVPVGYSESIFQPLGADLGLKLLTPYSFAKAIAEGTEISAQDKQTVDAQAQNATDQGLGLQQPERDARRPADQRDLPGRAHPDRDGHRDALAGLDELRAVAGRRAAGPAQARSHAATGR